MANFSTESGQVEVAAAAPQTIIQGVDDWAVLSLKLEGVAGGDNQLLVGKGGIGMLVEAGDSVGPLLISPGTQVQMKTTAAANVTWGYVVTYFPGNMMLAALAYAMGYLNVIACAVGREGAVEAVDKELTKAGFKKEL